MDTLNVCPSRTNARSPCCEGPAGRDEVADGVVDVCPMPGGACP
jgi:hypothetical protein